MARGDAIEFENGISTKHNAENPEEEVEIRAILEKILHKQVIRKTSHESTEFVSPIFIVKNPDDGTRLILNLKELNEFVKYEHFLWKALIPL